MAIQKVARPNIDVGTESEQGIQYLLKPVPRFMQKAGDDCTARVQVVPRRTVHHQELLQKVVEGSFVDAAAVKYVFDKLSRVLLDELKAGNLVSFSNYFMFGTSIQGRVSPQHPEDVKALKVVPTVRFSQPFNRALNRNVTKQYLATYQPTEVVVNELLSLGSGCTAYGRFHNLQSLKVEMLIGDAVVPCKFRLNKDSNSTRDIGKTLTIIPLSLPPPPGPRTVRFSYLESTGERKTFEMPAKEV